MASLSTITTPPEDLSSGLKEIPPFLALSLSGLIVAPVN
jgi:hypothetical protein